MFYPTSLGVAFLSIMRKHKDSEKTGLTPQGSCVGSLFVGDTFLNGAEKHVGLGIAVRSSSVHRSLASWGDMLKAKTACSGQVITHVHWHGS